MLGQPSPGHVDIGHPNRGAVVSRCLSLVECGCGTGEECSPVVSSEHARECAHFIGLELFKDLPALGLPNLSVMHCIGHPNGPFRIEADSIRRNVHLTKKLGNVV